MRFFSSKQLNYKLAQQVWQCSLLALCGLLVGCANISSAPVTLPPLDTATPEIELPEQDLLALTPAMKSFVQTHAPSYLSKRKRAAALAWALYQRGGLNFEYQETETRSAAEAFAENSGNCIAFTHLFVAMAREAGLPAQYQHVDVPDNWNPRQGVLVRNRHVNAVIVDSGGSYTVDLNKRFIPRFSRVQVISDQQAAARHYNNLSVTALLEGDLPLAYAYSKRSIRFDAKQDYLWSNLGLIYKRNRQFEDARWAFERALGVNPREKSAINNLVLTYRELGQFEQAGQLARQHRRLLNKSPYYLYGQALKALAQAEYSTAERLLKRAVRKKRSEHRFYLALAKTHYEAGEIDQAKRRFKQARDVAPIVLLNSVYQHPFDTLMQSELR